MRTTIVHVKKCRTAFGPLRCLIVLVVLLQGCAALNPIKAVTDLLNPNKPSLSVDTEFVIGDKQETVNTQVGSTSSTKQEAEVINNKIINETDPFMLILLIFGWILPSPMEIWRGIKGLLHRTKDE